MPQEVLRGWVELAETGIPYFSIALPILIVLIALSFSYMRKKNELAAIVEISKNAQISPEQVTTLLEYLRHTGERGKLVGPAGMGIIPAGVRLGICSLGYFRDWEFQTLFGVGLLVFFIGVGIFLAGLWTDSRKSET